MKIHTLNRIIAGLLILTQSACQNSTDSPALVEHEPVKVEVRSDGGRFQLYRGGQPFYIRGAGLEFGNVEKLAAHGGNSFRTWRTENGRNSAEEVLDRAHKNGLTVAMGLDMARERLGFDYSNPEAVQAQLEDMREQVSRLKDHPAILMWVIGNELNLRATNPAVWGAVNDVSLMIHEVDGNHPTTTALAGINKELVVEIKNRASDLDLLSIQMYADISNLPRYLKEVEWTGPYVVSEWGATGHWEVPLTPWQAPIENISSVKADAYQERFRIAIESDKTQCLGSYVFLWGQKMERTPTWYGIFLESGEDTEATDVMHRIWNGDWPENRSPRLISATIEGKTAHDGVYLDAKTEYSATAVIEDPDGDVISYFWEIKPEATELGDGGDFEPTPISMPELIPLPETAQVTFSSPVESGAYRLFVYAYDGHDHGAHANIPFYVND